MVPFFANLTACVVGLEACGGERITGRGDCRQPGRHTVRLIAPQFVKPFVKANKNDANDAEAICEAVGRPNMRFVPAKSVEQQDIQSLHRVRSRLVGCRTQLVNQVRGLLMEYGIVIPQYSGQVRREVPEVLENESNELTSLSRRLLAALYDELVELDKKVTQIERELRRVYEAREPCQRIAAAEGIGLLTATAIVAAMSDGKLFENGRQFAAWLGLVPKNTLAVANRVYSASASVETPICEPCSSMELDPSCIEHAVRRMSAVCGSQTNSVA